MIEYPPKLRATNFLHPRAKCGRHTMDFLIHSIQIVIGLLVNTRAAKSKSWLAMVREADIIRLLLANQDYLNEAEIHPIFQERLRRQGPRFIRNIARGPVNQLKSP